MGETVIRVSLSELQTVRLKCKKCHGTVEVSLDKLGSAAHGGKCPLCRYQWYDDQQGKSDRLADFATAAANVLHVDGVEVEFVVPQSSVS